MHWLIVPRAVLLVVYDQSILRWVGVESLAELWVRWAGLMRLSLFFNRAGSVVVGHILEHGWRHIFIYSTSEMICSRWLIWEDAPREWPAVLWAAIRQCRGWAAWAAIRQCRGWAAEFNEQWYRRVDGMSREDQQIGCIREFLCDTSTLFVKASLSCFWG